jgi:beta-glucosidase
MGCSWVLLSREALILKALDAGIDQLGGECCSEVIVGQLRDGRLDETRLDVSVRRLPREKSIHGLFDNPFKTDRPLFRFGHGLTK